MIKISVIIPIYNTEKYIKECLNSIINQTLKEIEIICINDGSTDNSLKILEQYAQKDKRIIILNQENSGSAIARNKAINIAKGEYLSFIDSDDYVDLSYLEKLYNATNNSINEVVATVNVVLVDEFYNKTYKNTYTQKSKLLDLIERANMFIKTSISCNKIYKTSFIKENNIHFPELNSVGQDLYFTLFSLLLAKQVNTINNTTYYYRQISSAQTKLTKYQRHFHIIDFYKLIENRLSETKINYFKKIYWQYCINQRKKYDLTMFYNSMHKDYKKDFKSKIKSEFPRIEIKKEAKNLIVSLTSYPKRISYVYQCISSLLNQTVEPEKIILVLAQEEFPNKEKDLPQNLLSLIEQGLEIQWYDNIKSYKKLIPILEKYPNKIIVTADDDNIYEPDWLANLYKAYKKNPNMVHCTRGHRLVFNENKEIEKYSKWPMKIYNVSPSYNNFFTAVGGVLDPPKCFHKDILNKKLFLELSKDTDDIWFWAMSVLNDTKINIISKKPFIIRTVDNTQEDALWTTNILDGNNDRNLIKVTNYYPELIKKLDKKKFHALYKIKTFDLKQFLSSPKEWLLKYKLKQILKKQKNRTLLWGASLFLKEVLEHNKIKNSNIIGIIDKNSNKWGSEIGGYKIYSPEQIKKLDAKNILLTTKNSNELIYSNVKNFLEQNHPNLNLLPNIFKQ